ncbi:serine hydrolase domain-containing protein [Thermodesulfobacteriota bacterium]
MNNLSHKMENSSKTQIHFCKTTGLFLIFFIFFCFLCVCDEKKELNAQTIPQNYKAPPDTGDGWETTNISNVGLDAKLLLKMLDHIRNNVYPNIHSVLIVKDNKLVMEEYFDGKDRLNRNISYNMDTLHELHSVTKSFTSTLIGIAIGQGLISGVDAKVVDLLPKYNDFFNDDIKKGILLKHLLSMTSGIKWDEWTHPYSDPRNSIAQINKSPNPARFVLSQPMETLPGWKYAYSSGVSILLGEIISGVSNMSVSQFAEKFLFQPLGIDKYYWSHDPNGIYYTGGGLQLRPRDMAKLGLLFLNGGRCKSNQIIPKTWVEEATKNHISHLSTGFEYGYQWWPRTNWVENRYIDTINAEGRGGQFIIIVPGLELVAVFTGWNDNNLYRQPIKLLVEYILPSASEEY